MKQLNDEQSARKTEVRARSAALRFFHEELTQAEKDGDRNRARKAATTIIKSTSRRITESDGSAKQPELFNAGETPTESPKRS
jgi:DNA-binding FadR family transcriptional regulator